MLLTGAGSSVLVCSSACRVTSSLVFLATTAALLLSAGLLAASFGLRSVPSYVLAIYVIAYAELVLLVTILSLADLVVRWTVIAGVTALLAAAVVTWALAGRPRGPSLLPALHGVRAALRDPPLAILAAAVAVGLAYLTALALFTPPNSIDALWYHLTRAAMWKQEHGVGYIAGVNDARLNGNPPVAEIAVLYTMVVSGTDRLVTMVALAAYVALPLTVFGIARRLLVDRGPALCAALVFATLPVTLLQASGAKNDLVLASFATACVYFCLGRRRVEVVLTGLALALALGTKIFAPLFVPIIGLIVAVGTSKRRALALTAVAIPAIVAGSTWNVMNLIHTSSYSGGLSDGPLGSGGGGGGGRSGALGFLDFVPTTIHYLIDFGELPGAAGWWFACYVGVALALAAFLLRNHDRQPRTQTLAAGLFALIPFFVIALGPLAKRGYQYLLFHLGRPDLGVLDYGRDFYGANQMSTYYGPVGLAVLLSVFVLVRMRRVIPRIAIVLAATPLLLVLSIAIFVGYSETSGRFFVFAVALGTAAFALFLSSRPIIWAVVALSVPTLALTLRANVEKPLSVWGKPRKEVQTLLVRGNEETRLIRFADESVPRRARLGLALDVHDLSYPFFDSHLERRVRFVSSTQTLLHDLDWLAVSPRRLPPRGLWQEVLRTPGGWRLYKR